MTVLFLDSYNLIHRSRFDWGGGLAKGDNQIIYNFVKSIKPIIEKFSPSKVFFVLDGNPKDRLQIDPEYKGTRYSTDQTEEEKAYWESFHKQKRFIINLAKNSLPFTTVYHPDLECDDIINYLAASCTDNNIIVSSDTDFIQTLDSSPNTSLWNPVSNSYREKMEVSYLEYKSLVGDKSDNIPGVKGIGKVGALKLLKNPSSLVDKLKNSDFKAQYEHSYSLVKFADLSEKHKEFQYNNGTYDEDEMLKIFTSLGFNSLVNDNYMNSFSKVMRGLVK